MGCVFCNISDVVVENELALAFYDKYPVNKGHMLIIPKRHVADYFSLSNEEISSINDLLFKCKVLLDEKYHPSGYNIGVNCGKDAGQTIFHCHVHIIPRYKGDIDDPRGGVRGVIPEKRIY
jgi:diadenosine tetraphosphate (Ap4A) HIT family hydrolase